MPISFKVVVNATVCQDKLDLSNNVTQAEIRDMVALLESTKLKLVKMMQATVEWSGQPIGE